MMGVPIMVEVLLLIVGLNGVFGPGERVPVYWIYKATRVYQFIEYLGCFSRFL